MDLYRKVGDRRGEAVQTNNLAEEDRADGNYGAARDRYRAATVIARETGYRPFEAATGHNLGETLTVLGEMAVARECLDAATVVARESGIRPWLGYACRSRADVAVTLGDAASAMELYGTALAIAREVKFAVLEAEALTGLGRVHAHAGTTEGAASRLDEALEVARRIDDPNTIALAAAIRAALPGGSPRDHPQDGLVRPGDMPVAAAKTLDDLGTRPWHVARMEARWWLWKATNDRAHLMESWRLLRHLRDHAPEENRTTVIANVPLHRDIAAAAKEAGL